MKFITAAASLALASVVSAAPRWADWAPKSCPEAQCPDVECPVDTCLQQSDAEDIVNKFISVLNHPDVKASNATAQALIGDDFFEESDSINMLAGHPVGSVTFSGKQNYINGVLYAPSITDIETIKVMPAGCNNVLWYWQMIIGSKQIPVKGMNLFEIDDDGKIADMYVEFNNIAWGIDIGFTATNPGGKKLPTA
ncbi:uncharacterized protein A1O9_01096 [Exophiala aquamarina CBS 119918]|uniref:NTF2-like domain-containing protein n=1 Tax=Exophiala aquamarina CBS 119918 TaxID=1182545 RepID=A0A072Q5B0_9EURO|nr:uncharacterized protein A1O9_01096 [Exophiala aquamarina CBS 119918]KEF63120.1 hypothetical protein A1O9_01096 [Exophiala aquamarina CBS 119918]